MGYSFVVPLALAAILGAILGIDRSVAGKHAGMRTYALVSMGSALFVLVGLVASQQLEGLFPGTNPLTIASNVVVAIGFLGAGLTVFRGEHPVELTTAAGLWVSAGVGMAVGFGFYTAAFVTVILSLLIFSVLLPIENWVRRQWGREND
jgi:putative Mg2+ transporter-C (MgtC) family protein